MTYDLTTQAGGAVADRFAQGRAQRGSVAIGDGVGLKVDDRTGEMTYGQENVPLDPGHKFVVPITGFRYGFVTWEAGKPVDRQLVGLHTGAKIPEPAVPYAQYPNDGPRRAAELDMHSVEEPGFKVTLWASTSSANRMDNLASEVEMQMRTPDGQAGFRHPVIRCKTDKYFHRKYSRDVWHWAYEIVDWMHDDGETLLSTRGGAITNGSDEAPFDDDVGVDDLLS